MRLIRAASIRWVTRLRVWVAGALLASSVQAQTFHVAPSGNDSASGTETHPWRTVQKACETVGPGSTVVVHEGVYHEIVWMEVEGNAEAGPITIRAEGEVVISGEGVNEDFLFYIENRSYLRIIGFELRDVNTEDGSGIRLVGACSHIELRDNRIHNIRGKNAMGITVYATSPDEPVTNLIIAGNVIYDCDAAPSEALTLNGNVDGFLVEENHVHDVNGIGIDFIGGEDWISTHPDMVSRNGICRKNRVERARSNYGGGYGAGIYVDGGRDILIEHNVVSECDLGIEVGAENAGFDATGVVVRGNVVTGNDKAGIVFGGYSSTVGLVRDCFFFNNRCEGNTGHGDAQAEIWVQRGSGNVLANNLIVGSGSHPLIQHEGSEDAATFRSNLYYAPEASRAGNFVWRGQPFSTLVEYREATGQDAGSLWGDPLLGPGGHLTRDSPAIDAGDPSFGDTLGTVDLDGEPRRDGSGIDIGPDEFHP